ncbi:MAG: N-formylglutamate amidohydrolase [Hyphomicrobiaceae bacterium]
MPSNNQHGKDREAVVVRNAGARSSIVIACEHASSHIPARFHNLGLNEAARLSHIAWDPGAFAVAQGLSDALQAQLVASRVSRLVVDCNRAADAEDAIPGKSEIYDVPGNIGLSSAERADRMQQVHDPFHACLADALDRAGDQAVLVTIHTFTPVYMGQARSVELGVLHDCDSRLADAILSSMKNLSSMKKFEVMNVSRNAPYGPEDGVTYTLLRHGVRRSIRNVMLEIRNDLVATASDQHAKVELLAGVLREAVEIPLGDFGLGHSR